MNVAELRQVLAGCDPEAVVTVIDPHLHVDCHIQLDVSQPFTVTIESTGRVVTEEDLA